MDEDRSAQVCGCLEERKEFGGVQVPVVAVRTDLHALQAQFVDATLQFADGQIRSLQWHRADTRVMTRVVVAHLRHVVVEMPMQLERLVTGCPIGKKDRHGGHHLYVHTEAGIVVDAGLRVEGRVPYLAEKLAVLVDAVPSIGVGHHRKAVVAVLCRQIGPVAGQDVGVGIDLEHAIESSRAPARSP